MTNGSQRGKGFDLMSKASCSWFDCQYVDGLLNNCNFYWETSWDDCATLMHTIMLRRWIWTKSHLFHANILSCIGLKSQLLKGSKILIDSIPNMVVIFRMLFDDSDYMCRFLKWNSKLHQMLCHQPKIVIIEMRDNYFKPVFLSKVISTFLRIIKTFLFPAPQVWVLL